MTQKIVSLIRNDPAGFINRLGLSTWSKQREIIEALFDNHYVAVKSGNGVGKTYIASLIVHLFLLMFPGNSIVITTAPTWRQVEMLLWREIQSNNIYYHDGKKRVIVNERNFKRAMIDLGPRHYAKGISTNEETNFQGFHAENILYIIDEANGVPDEIFNAISGSLTGNAYVLMLGNPIIPMGYFHRCFFEKESKLYHQISIPSFLSPNITGEKKVIGLADMNWINNRETEWGKDSPVYISRVLADFPDYADDILIPYKSILNCKNIEVQDGNKRLSLGVDVARKGSDETVFIEVDNNKVTDMVVWQKNKTTDVSGYIRQWYEQKKDRDPVIGIDDTGLGGGVVDECDDMGVPVLPFIAGSTEGLKNKDIYANLKAESMYEMRNSIIDHRISIPDDELLIKQLRTLRLKFTQKGKMRVEDPADSPDRADALNIALWAQNNQFTWSIV